jgi:hypothetical protein
MDSILLWWWLSQVFLSLSRPLLLWLNRLLLLRLNRFLLLWLNRFLLLRLNRLRVAQCTTGANYPMVRCPLMLLRVVRWM